MTFDIYQPVPVLLPEDTGLRREFLTRESTIDDVPLSDAEYAQYDSCTVFYDVFRREEEPRRVIAIGPPPVNLLSELRGLRITRDGRRLRHMLRRYPHLVVVEIDLDDAAARLPERELELRFVFPSFTAEVRVPPSSDEKTGASAPGDGAAQSPPESVAMMTLQKDNEVAWIEDWCRWHRRLHGVSRFRIYDNGSANIAAVEEALRRLGGEMDITLVRWPYLYGPARSDKNRFSQIGAQNHCRLRFGARDAWCIAMDVDEYLVASGPRALAAHLAACEREGVSSVFVDSFVVPPHPGQPPAPQRRIHTHAWRDRHALGYALKCISAPARSAYNRAHIVYPRNRFFDRFSGWARTYKLVPRLLYGSIPKRISRLERAGTRPARFATWLLRLLLPGHRTVRHLAPDELFFFHFKGLNTHWRSGGAPVVEVTERFDPARHVEEPRFRTLAERAGLIAGED